MGRAFLDLFVAIYDGLVNAVTNPARTLGTAIGLAMIGTMLGAPVWLLVTLMRA